MILHDKNKEEFGIEFETCKVYDKFYCVCDYCGKEFLRTKRNITVCNKVINKDSCGDKECSKQKREESQMLTYGVPNSGGTLESQEKAKSTWLSKYGLDNPSKSQEVKEKIKKTCVDRLIRRIGELLTG